MSKKRRKNRKDSSNLEKTKQVFQQLDECVKRAREAETTGNWSEAQQEAESLRRLTGFVRSAEVATHSVAAISGMYKHDWILVAVSAITALGILIVLYTSRRRE